MSKRILLPLCLFLCARSAAADDWPGWRGPRRDNHVEGFRVPDAWPKELKKQWSVRVGVGEASPLLAGDKIYTFGRQGDEEVTLCLEAAGGKELWKDHYKADAVKGPASGFPGPRATPALADGKVCTLGVGGVVSCLDAQSGKLLWRHDTKGKPGFYTSSSPVLGEGKTFVFTDQLIAYALDGGDKKWTAKGLKAPYGSPVLAKLAGAAQIVTPAAGQLVGVAPEDGKVLWSVKLEGGYQTSYSTPLIEGDFVYYFVPGGKGGKGGKGGAGAARALKIEKKGDEFTATEAWTKALTAAGYHTPVLRDGMIFGVNPSRNFFCMDAKTGETLWIDKDHQRGQCGSILSAGSVLVALTSDKDLVVFRPSRKGYEEVAKYQVSSSEPWSVPILAGNRIFVKDKAGSLTLWTVE